MIMAEISQLKLKHCNENEINCFALLVLDFINPNFNSETEYNIAKICLIEFAKTCEITADEFIHALELASENKLYTEPNSNGNSERIKLFKIIDRVVLGQVKAAYLHVKRVDSEFQKIKSEVKKLREEKIPTEEEKKEIRLNFLKEEYLKLQKDGYVFGTTIFYELIKKKGVETVKLNWLDRVLESYNPTPKKNMVNDIFKKNVIDPKTYFIDCLVSAYFQKEKLKELSEVEFINYWNEI